MADFQSRNEEDFTLFWPLESIFLHDSAHKAVTRCCLEEQVINGKRALRLCFSHFLKLICEHGILGFQLLFLKHQEDYFGLSH